MTDQNENPPEKPPETAPETPLPVPQPKNCFWTGRFWGSCCYHILLPLLLLLIPISFATFGFAPGFVRANKTLVIPRGTSVQEIGQMLEANELIPSGLLFKALSHILAANNLHAGEYQFTPEQSMADMVLMMRDGKSVIRRLTAPEGLMTSEIVKMIENDPALSGTITVKPQEGSLLPETYHYSYGDSRNGILDRMQKAAREELEQLWKERAPGLPYASPKEALVMASLVEKETGKKAEERPKVAAVFINRLRIGMRLQSDPTVIYALTEGKEPLARDLTHQDLEVPSPYNTYVNAGLPPKPICNPGTASLKAVLHPETNDYLYFVADGTGGHAFAKDLPTHNKNVSNWLKATHP